MSSPVQVERRRRVGRFAVAVEPDPDELVRLDLEAGLLAQLSAERVERVLGLVEETARDVPRAAVGIAGTADEQQAVVLVEDEGADGRLRVRVGDEAAGRALDPLVGVRELGPAARAEAPVVHSSHAGSIESRTSAPARRQYDAGVLVGRESECARIERLLGAAREGQGGTLLLHGEPGIGKTELLRHAIRAATGFVVLTATGVEAEVARGTYGGVADLVQPLQGQIDRLPTRQRKTLAGVLGRTAATIVEPAAAAAAVFALVLDTCRERPVLVAVDDASWLDETSRDVVLFLARRSDLGGFAVIVATRESEAGQLSLRGAEELRLTGLSWNEAASLIESRASTAPTPEVARALVAQTKGNPLALVELARLATPEELSGASQLRSPLPVGETVEILFASLVDSLDQGARTALLVAAASERRELAPLARASSRLGADAESFERAEAAGLLEIGAGKLAFRHPLLRAVAYHRADPAERRAAHRALAEVEPDTERRARHLAAAATGPDQVVAAALEQSADDARRRGALAAAATSLSLAARLSPQQSDSTRRWLAAAQTAHEAGQSAQAMAAAEQVLLDTDDPCLEADAALVKGMVLDVSRRPDEAARLLESHAERVAVIDGTRALHLLCEASGCWFHAMEFAQALTDMRRCEQLAASTGEGDVLLRLSIGNALSNMGHAAESRPLLEPGVAEVELIEDLAAQPELAGTAATALMHLEQFDRARALLARQADQERRSGALSILVRTLALQTSVEMHSGEWPAAAIGAEEVARLAADLSQAMVELWGHVMRAQTAAAQGDEIERETRLALAADLADETGMRRVVEISSAEARGLAHLGNGEYELAAGTYAQLEDLDASGGSGSLSRWLPELAESYARAGREGDARGVLHRLDELHADSGQAWAQAAIARLRGLLDDDFDDSFARALELGGEAQNAFERARTALCYGERLRRAGERKRSRAQLADALATFTRLGARPWAERAEAELRASGQTRAPQRSYGTVLTPSEQQVAALVADGLSNREIAMRLFVSVRTVEMHVSNAYRKLGIRSRTGLARYVLSGPAPAEHEPLSTH